MKDYEIEVCDDCLMPIIYGDYTGLQYYYNGKELDKRIDGVNKGIDAIDGYMMASSKQSLEFSKNTCDCCGSKLAGVRHIINVMTPVM